MTLGRAGSEIEFPAGDERVPAYLTAPESGTGRGVLVLHEAEGLGAHIRDACDRLAREGFVALAPDLYRGRLGRHAPEAEALMSELDVARVGADVDGAVSALLNDHRVDGGRVGALGFCIGGTLALFAATRSPRIGAAVSFYGVASEVPLDLARLEAPVLAVFGADDESISRGEIEQLEVTLRAAGRRPTVRVKPGLRHAFMNGARPDRFDAAAAAEGWDELLAFLRAELE